jgi:hypothetical protein
MGNHCLIVFTIHILKLEISWCDTMPGPSCERVARCREKSRTRRFAVSQGFLRQPIFATAAASSSLPSHPFQLYHVLPAAQVSVPPTTSE